MIQHPAIDITGHHRGIRSDNPILSPSLSSPSTPLAALLSPGHTVFPNGSPLIGLQFPKFSIRHQDAEVSIADATDCLRMVSGKIDWFHRKAAFCPHLISADDATQIAVLHQKLLIEEIPFLELQTRLCDGLSVDIPRELEGRVQGVCDLFVQLKQRIDDLITNIAPTIIMNGGHNYDHDHQVASKE